MMSLLLGRMQGTDRVHRPNQARNTLRAGIASSDSLFASKRMIQIDGESRSQVGSAARCNPRGQPGKHLKQ